MITNGTNSFVTSLYADGLIQWPIGDAFWGHQWVVGTQHREASMQGWCVCVFLFFSVSLAHKQPCTIVNMDTTSNVGVPGLRME